MFTQFLNKSVTVERLATTTGDVVEYASASSFMGNLQQTSPEMTALVGGAYGKTWRLYAQLGVDIINGDRVSIDGKSYTVKGVKILTIPTSGIDHTEIILTENNP